MDRYPTTPLEISISIIDASEPVSVEVEVSGERQEVRFLPDAEAKIDAIPLATYATQLSRMQLQKAITPKTATGVLTHMEGKFAQRRVGTINIHVLHNLAQPALSGDAQIP